MTYRPASTAAIDPDLIHTSARTTLTTNATGNGAAPRVTLRVTRLEMRWHDGDVVVRFSAQEAEVMPRPRPTANRAQFRGRTC